MLRYALFILGWLLLLLLLLHVGTGPAPLSPPFLLPLPPLELLSDRERRHNTLSACACISISVRALLTPALAFSAGMPPSGESTE